MFSTAGNRDAALTMSCRPTTILTFLFNFLNRHQRQRAPLLNYGNGAVECNKRILSLVLRSRNIRRICWKTLNSYSQGATLNSQTDPYSPEGQLCKKHSPVWVFLQHLIDADTEGLVIVTFMDEIFVYPKLSSSDCLALWDTWQVKTEFSVMSSHWQELLIVLHWKKRGKRETLRINSKRIRQRCRYTQMIVWCESGLCGRLAHL